MLGKVQVLLERSEMEEVVSHSFWKLRRILIDELMWHKISALPTVRTTLTYNWPVEEI